MATTTAMDEYFVHQIPECLPSVAVHHHHWRESYFYELHDPAGEGDAVFFTMAHYPAQARMDSLQMGRVGGEQVLGVKGRPYDGDPHTTEVPGARVEVVTPMREVRLWAEPVDGAIGLDLTWRARTQPYALRRGTMRAGHELVWDQSHILQSGNYTGRCASECRTSGRSPTSWTLFFSWADSSRCSARQAAEARGSSRRSYRCVTRSWIKSRPEWWTKRIGSLAYARAVGGPRTPRYRAPAGDSRPP